MWWGNSDVCRARLGAGGGVWGPEGVRRRRERAGVGGNYSRSTPRIGSAGLPAETMKAPIL